MAFEIKRDWTTEAGLRAVVIQGASGGFRHHCGYVAIPKTHFLHGVGYGESVARLPSAENLPIGAKGAIPLFCAGLSDDDDAMRRPDVVFDVHGSITYDGKDGYPVDTGEDCWWYGFDCNHAGDDPDIHGEGYVAQECERLAKQLADVAKEPTEA